MKKAKGSAAFHPSTNNFGSCNQKRIFGVYIVSAFLSALSTMLGVRMHLYCLSATKLAFIFHSNFQ